ncbi:MAG: reactive intermediate/imine deaminase [Gammaproteobacteria bacterium]|nr:reactive intermediate/imine deaminase [Gammaproteobacteria bacterium]
MEKQTIQTDKAPDAIGTYSQAVSQNGLVFLSGQIGLDPSTMKLIDEDFVSEAKQAFRNLSEVALASGATLDAAVKINIYLRNLDNFQAVNEIMLSIFKQPYPARAVIGVSSLPKNANIEVDAILCLANR